MSLPTPDPPSDSQTAAIVGEHSKYMVATYVRPPPMMAKGEGCYLWDVENRRYLDFTAGIAVNALGHCDPETSKILAHQVHFSPFRSCSSPSVLTIHSVPHPRPHLQPLPQPLDRRPLPTPRAKDPLLRHHDLRLQSLRLQLRQRSQ